VKEAPSETLARALADFLEMNVFVFGEPITFATDYITTPPEIHVRGRIMLGVDEDSRTKDLHTLDGEAQRFP
jgi:hypothetical protein